MEFARRSRKLYAPREAVVDGELSLTMRNSFERCDRRPPVSPKLGIGKGDRVATIASTRPAHLEQFYAVPQLGAVVVPLTTGSSRRLRLSHQSQRRAHVPCAHSDYLDMVEGIRRAALKVEHFVALKARRPVG